VTHPRAGGLLLVSLVVSAHAQVGPGPVPLAYLPHDPITFRVQETRIEVELHGGRAPAPQRFDLTRTVRRTASPSGADLRVTLEDVAPGAIRGGSLVPAARPVVTTMTSRGLPVDAAPAPAPAPMALVLPEEPLPMPLEVLGMKRLDPTTWTVETAPTGEMPIPVRTRHRVAGLQVAGGRECVVIELSARGDGTLDSGRRKVEYWGRGRVVFDPATGAPVESEQEVRVDDVVLPPPREGLQRRHTETHTRTTRVPAK
jgi:hypothetical protein